MNLYFCHQCVLNIFKIKLDILSFRDRLYILLEKKLNGVIELRYKMLNIDNIRNINYSQMV